MANSRRTFFRSLFVETFSLYEESTGTPQFRLDDLPGLSNEELGRLIPSLAPDVELIPDGSYLHARIPPHRELICLFSHTPENTWLFNQFDGRTELAAVGRALATRKGQTRTQAFVRVRELFLDLVNKRVCVPTNPGVRNP